jgi:WD40 repeat protein
MTDDDSRPEFGLGQVGDVERAEAPAFWRLSSFGTASHDRRSFMRIAAASLGAAACARDSTGPGTSIDPVSQFQLSLYAQGCIRALQFTPDNRFLVSAGDGRPITCLPRESGELVGSELGNLKIWEVPPGRLVTTVRQRAPIELPGTGHSVLRAASISPDGRTVAVAGQQTLQLYTIPAGEYVRDLVGGPFASRGSLISLTFNPAGTILASGGPGAIWLWEIPSGRLLATLPGRNRGRFDEETFFSLQFLDGGELLLSGSGNGPHSDLVIWDVTSAAEVQRIRGDIGEVHIHVSLSVDGRYLIDATNYGVKVRETAGWTVVEHLEPEDVGLAAMSRDMRFIAYATRAGMKAWSFPQRRLVVADLIELNPFASPTVALDFSPNGRYLAAPLGSGIRIWEVPRFHPVATLFDPTLVPSDVTYRVYTMRDGFGDTVQGAGPCNIAPPPGATVTQDCIAGTFAGTTGCGAGSCFPQRGGGSGGGGSSGGSSGGGIGGGWICTCVPVVY